MSNDSKIQFCLEYLSKFSPDSFDVRVTNDIRFCDHKCTPDIVCFIADCILCSNLQDTKFTVKNVWDTDYFVENVRIVYNKPDAKEKTAKNEYNKVISQPLKLLAYAKILKVETIKNTLHFSVENVEMLEWISRNVRNSYAFISLFFEKVMEYSGFAYCLENYKTAVTTNPQSFRKAKEEIYDRFHTFVSENTPTQSKLDTTRIFHKIFNLFAYKNRIPGSNGDVFSFYDLMYNRENWRDIGKDKSQTRQEHRETQEQQGDEFNQYFTNYYIQKAIKQIKKLHFSTEVSDPRYKNEPADQVHHIFPKSEYPQFATYLENLILLTATQHLSLAHPNNNTHIIDKDFQGLCLVCKADTIDKSINKLKQNYYSKDLFLEVVNTGLSISLPADMPFATIKEEIVKVYNQL